MSNEKILLVEDEQITSIALQGMLEEMEYEVVSALTTGDEVLDELRSEPVDLVLLDIKIPGELDGIETAEKINEEFDLPFVFITAYSDEATLSQAKETNPAGFLVKPLTKEDLRSTIEVALSNHVKK